MAAQRSFEVEVACASQDGPHTHRLRVEVAEDPGRTGLPRGPRVVGQRQIEYTCPDTGELRAARFTPPAGFYPPFRLVSVE